ncbi:MAG: ABC transporter permease [Gemmatimonadaceae bacterium]
MDTFFRDIRYSLRRLQKTPGFTLVVVLTLALGIGANTAIFSVVNAVLLRPLPYREPEKLVTIFHLYPGLNNLEASVSAPAYREYRDRAKSFESVAVETGMAANLTGTGEPERVPASRVSGQYFKVMGVQPQLGRALLVEEDEPGKNQVVVISDGLWKRVFGADPRIVGKKIQLNARDFEIVGVMPHGFRGFFNRDADVWTPLALEPDNFTRWGNEFLNVVARTKPGVTTGQAQSEMRAFAEQLKRDRPDQWPDSWTLKITSLEQLATGRIRPALLVLLGAVGFVLLIACANVANLLLARAAARMKEIAIRSALGADRGRLVRQLLTESVLLALAGALVGTGLAYWTVKAIVALTPNLPRADEIGVNPTVMLFTLVVAVVTGLLFGLAPALQTSRTDLQSTLREGGRTGAAELAGRGLRRALVVAETALALTLLVGAGLLIKSVARLQGVDPGFKPERLLTFTLALPRARYASDTAQIQYFDRVLPAVAAVPGVRGVGATSVLPFGGNWTTSTFTLEGHAVTEKEPNPWGDMRVINADFFKTMGVRVVEGRAFTDADGPGAMKVAVVDEEFVRRYSKGRSAVGRRISFRNVPGDTVPEWRTIVGVVRHTMHEGLDAEPRLQWYLPYRQFGRPNLTLAVRTSGEPLAMTRAVREAVRSVDRDMPLADVKAMEDRLEQSLGQRRLSMFLLGGYAAVALLLASVGLYGVMSYSVTQRQREIGVRMALGARRGSVLGLVLRQGMGLVVLGVGLGLLAAFGLSRLLASQLYSVKPTDPGTFALVALTLSAVAFVALLLPALRATRVDPVVVLREE